MVQTSTKPQVYPTMPGRDYHAEDVFDLEREKIFHDGWVCVGRAELLANPGDFITREIFGESVLIVCTKDAELKGYPVRIEVGPRDLASGNVTLVTRVDGQKRPMPLDEAVEATTRALSETQETLLAQARTRREERTADVSTVDEAIAAATDGWACLPWSKVGVEGENKANAQGVTVRCLTRADGSVPDSEDEPDLVAYLARAY